MVDNDGGMTNPSSKIDLNNLKSKNDQINEIHMCIDES